MLVHKCDLCKEEAEDYSEYTLPVRQTEYAMRNGIKLAAFSIGIKPKKVELCPKCQAMLANVFTPILDEQD